MVRCRSLLDPVFTLGPVRATAGRSDSQATRRVKNTNRQHRTFHHIVKSRFLAREWTINSTWEIFGGQDTLGVTHCINRDLKGFNRRRSPKSKFSSPQDNCFCFGVCGFTVQGGFQIMELSRMKMILATGRCHRGSLNEVPRGRHDHAALPQMVVRIALNPTVTICSSKVFYRFLS